RWPRDWSSDVCSSDLSRAYEAEAYQLRLLRLWCKRLTTCIRSNTDRPGDSLKKIPAAACVLARAYYPDKDLHEAPEVNRHLGERSEERRVGKECRSRG